MTSFELLLENFQIEKFFKRNPKLLKTSFFKEAFRFAITVLQT
jgi:hypothetical protein